MITYLAIASLLASALAGLWLILASLKSGPRRWAACVVVGGIGLFLAMTLFLGPFTFSSEYRPLVAPPAPTVTPAADEGVPIAAYTPVAGPAPSGPSPFLPTCGPIGLLEPPEIAGDVVDGTHVALVQISRSQTVGEPAGRFLRMTLHLTVRAAVTGAESGPRRFALSDLWIMPVPAPSSGEFNPQPVGAAIAARGDWASVAGSTVVEIEATGACSILVDFLVPMTVRTAVIYVGFRQLWTIDVPNDN